MPNFHFYAKYFYYLNRIFQFLDLWAELFTFDDIMLRSTSTRAIFIKKKFQQETCSGFTNTDRIKEKVLGVLRQIYQEKGEEVVRADTYCHFGHAYINKVDERLVRP